MQQLSFYIAHDCGPICYQLMRARERCLSLATGV